MPAEKLTVGCVVADKYKLEERLGGGGMGDVYRAQHMLAGRTVAIKLLRRDYTGDQDLTRRLFLEAQAVNKIRHPAIVDVLDAGFADDERPYVVMEYLEGASLAQALSRVGRLDLATALAVVLPMLGALDAAHRHGIVHRDLKPENVYLADVDGEVRVKLLDFGIAKVLDTPSDASPRTNTGVIFGTPDYLSPEQASGEVNLDGRSDLFAVGTVLFELLTGRRPFEAQTAIATAYRIVHVQAPTLASAGVSVPPVVQVALDTALAKRPDDRYSTASSFADALAPVVPGGASRRRLLRALLDAAFALQPTQAAPAVGAQPSLSFEPSLPRVVGEKSAEPVVYDLVDTPMPTAPPPEDGPRSDRALASPARVPAAPTMVSNSYVAPAATPPLPVRERMPSRPSFVDTPHTPHTLSSSAAPLPPMRPPMRSEPRLQERPSSPRLSDRQSSPDLSPTPSARASLREPSSVERISSRLSSSPVGTLAWKPRALPAAARRAHTRGTFPRALCKWVERGFGAEGRDQVLGMLQPDLADSYRTDRFNALVWYDLEASDALLEAAAFALMRGDGAQWRRLARDNFERELGSIFRPTHHQSDPMTLLKRVPAAWGRLFDFGTVKMTETTGSDSHRRGPDSSAPSGPVSRIMFRVDGFEAASLALRYVVTGTLEGLLLAPLSGVHVRPLVGEASFTRDFELELVWRKR